MHLGDNRRCRLRADGVLGDQHCRENEVLVQESESLAIAPVHRSRDHADDRLRILLHQYLAALDLLRTDAAGAAIWNRAEPADAVACDPASRFVVHAQASRRPTSCLKREELDLRKAIWPGQGRSTMMMDGFGIRRKAIEVHCGSLIGMLDHSAWAAMTRRPCSLRRARAGP